MLIETDPMINAGTDERGNPLILYFRGYDKREMQQVADSILPFVTKLNIVESNPNAYCHVIEYKIYILESDVDAVIRASESGKLKDNKKGGF